MRSALRWSAALVLAGLLVAGPAGARGTLSGDDAVWAKSTAAGTVLLGDDVYHVVPSTELRDASGRALTLAGLPVVDLPAGASRPDRTQVEARFEAVRRGDRLVLRSLELLPPGLE